MDDFNRTAAAGQDSGSLAITLLRDAVAVCRRHPRDPGATDLAIRAHRYLANFPVHFVTEYLVQGAEYPTRHRVPVAQWPTWADGLASSERNVQDAAIAWRQVLEAAKAAAPEEFTADRPGTNLERVLRVLAGYPSRGVVDGDTFEAISAEMREVVNGYDFDRDHDLSEWAKRIDALAALPAVPEGESVTLTVAQIADLARFAGLTLAQPPQPTADELEAQITVCECPDTGVLLDGEDADPGLVAHYTHTAYYSEYPGEGCIGLGPELVATPKDQPAQGEG